MKRILMVALTVALALGLAATAYAGELQLSGKEAGASVSYDGALSGNEIWIKVGSLDFVDGSFKFHLTDLVISFYPTDLGGATDDEISLNLDYGKWYAETGGDGIVFTLSNDRGKWVPYFGYMKPAAKITDDDPHRAKFLVTGLGKVAGMDVGFNAYETQNGVKDMNLTASATFGDATLAGFVGDFDGTDYYGGDVALAGVLGDATLKGGVYANTVTSGDNGLAYMAEVAGVKAADVAISAGYKFGNATVAKPSSWKDGNIPGANTKEFWAKAEMPLDFFGCASTLTGEFYRYIDAATNKIVITDKFSMSDSVKDVVLKAEVGSAVTDTYSAEATVLPGVAGLSLYPKVVNAVGSALEFRTAAEYLVGNATLRGGFIYKGGLDQYFAFGDSAATYGTLDTRIAGIYLKKNITSTAEVYTRGYLSATTDLNESLTGVGVQFLYKKDNTAAAQVTAAFGGKYAVSADTSMSVNYIFRDFSPNGHLFLEVKKTVGSATFALSYGENVGYEGADDGNVDKPSHKEWITKGNVPWRGINGVKSANQGLIKASVTVPF